MANKQHLKILRLGTDAWNQWRKENQRIEPDLREASLDGINLRRANLRSVNLNWAHLQEADLRGADFSRSTALSALLNNAKLQKAKIQVANFGQVNLSGADLFGAEFCTISLRAANLSDADFGDAHFSDVDFRGAFLRRANFTGATAAACSFTECDLSEVSGLESMTHITPSSVGVDTIYRSKGRIPESFLRGCGVPENLIAYIPSLVNSEDGIQFYSCFISYSGKDEEFAKRLHGKMRDAHLRVWFAPEDIQGGKKLHEQIEAAIYVFDKLLIVLSKASLKSQWVMTELRKARKAERQSRKRKLFPVRLVDMKTLKSWECIDPDTGEDLALEVRRYFIPDFSNWKDHDSFETAFTRLLKDLRAEERAK